MRVLRIYAATWIVVLGSTGASYSLGFMNATTFPIFGFVLSTLAAAGFMAVLPLWLSEQYVPKGYSVARKP